MPKAALLSRCFRLATALLAVLASLQLSGAARGSILPLGEPEQQAWSDMAFASGVTGGFNAGTKLLSITASPSNSLEIGSEFGPDNPGRNYGVAPADLGGSYSATLTLAGTTIEPTGIVSNGGTVQIVINGSAAGSIQDDYAFTNGGNPLPAGSVLLQGTVLAVLLDATGSDTLDVLWQVNSGALQFNNPALNENFAANGQALLRIAGVTMPSTWTSSFSLDGATINVLSAGVPEPSAIVLGSLAAAFTVAVGIRRRCRS